MLRKKSEKGQALVLIAFAAVGLFAFTALSVDGGRVFSDRRHAQNAADTAAFAAALAKLRAPLTPPTAANLAAVDAGLDRAETNGYANDADSTVEVVFCDDPAITQLCLDGGMPSGADASEYIRVKITSIVRTTFARIIGWQQVENTVTTIARADVNGLVPPFDGAAIVALSKTDPDAIGAGGNAKLTVNNSGVFSNSSDACAMSGNGNINFKVTTAYNVVGGSCKVGSVTFAGGPVQGAAQKPYPPDYHIPTPTITCSGDGRITNDATPGHYTIHPGNFNSGLNTNLPGTYTFVGGGSYCFHDDVTFNNAHVIANYADIKITAGDFQTNGNSSFTCDNVLVYTTGASGGVHFNGNAVNTCTNVTFFAETGSVSWKGNVTNTFTATTEGAHDEYSNLLIYMPYGNTSPLTIIGNAGNSLTGSIIAVSSPVTISGNSGTTGFNSSVTGYTITLDGNSETTINYKPEDQFVVLEPSGILLTK
jgi:hypothetical protein